MVENLDPNFANVLKTILGTDNAQRKEAEAHLE